MRLGELADRLEVGGDRLAGVGGRLADVDPGAAGFGADAPGRLGDLGRMLHGCFSAALTARAREAAAHGARLTDTADLLRVAAARYHEAEQAARQRHDIEAP
jgi:hypothetical protein